MAVAAPRGVDALLLTDTPKDTGDATCRVLQKGNNIRVQEWSSARVRKMCKEPYTNILLRRPGECSTQKLLQEAC